MVKRKTKIFIIFLCICFLNSCNVDLLGFFGSSDLDKRLKEKDNFRFLRPEDRTLSFGEEYSFIVLTDTHIEKGNAFGLKRLKDAIDSEVKFAIICGDITQNGQRKDVEKFREIAGALGVPCYPVIGNHDIYSGNWSNWKELIGSTRYRINGGSATLFILDSANCYFGDDQLNWLERELKNTKGRVFVFSHANLFMKNPLELQQFTDTRERARFISILKGRCDIMFMGHAHRRDVTEVGGVKFITVEDFHNNSVYCRISVKKTGITREFKKL